MIRRLPVILGIAAGLAALLVLGPIAAAVVLLRSSSDAVGPGLGVQLLLGGFVLLIAGAVGLGVAGLVRLLLRLAGR